MCPLHLRAELMDRFGVIEAAGRVRDEQGGFFISQQRAALALVAQGGEQLRIELIARAGDGLHRLLRDGEKQQDCDHGQRADGPSQPEQAVARGLRAGLRRERRAVDGVQHGRGEDEVRIGFIAVHHGQRPAEGKLRRRGCDGQNEDVRVLRHIDAARPREGVQTHFGGSGGADGVALQQLAELARYGVRHGDAAGGCGGGAAARHGEGDLAVIARLGHERLQQVDRHDADEPGQNGHPEIAQHMARETQRIEVGPFGRFLFFHGCPLTPRRRSE